MSVANADLLSAVEVAHRLGVKPETVYAYVSRGLLTRHPSSAHRHSLFAADEVERLAGKARHQNRSGALEVVVETELTALDPAGRLYFRGRDAIELARHRSFEAVAGLLWDGDPHAPWELDPPALEQITALRAALPGRVPAAELIPLTTSWLGATDPQRANRRPDAVIRAGARAEHLQRAGENPGARTDHGVRAPIGTLRVGRPEPARRQWDQLCCRDTAGQRGS
jgi:citrate synthase